MGLFKSVIPAKAGIQFFVSLLTLIPFSLHAVECKITFKMKIHAELLETGKGTGTITCDNGQNVPVIVTSAGSWIAVHKSRWIEGEGTFSKVDALKKLFGGYTPTRIDQIQQGPSPPGVLWHKDISLTFGGKDEDRLNYTRGRFKILPAVTPPSILQ
ncbi:MAG: hypothetical protein Q8P84_08360 [Deltaproteobacteria bacterium]|nr:hypothetical protein [Deltaproteobacteria bacterium]MDZ4224973.1 hypothetical protein [bacterium]